MLPDCSPTTSFVIPHQGRLPLLQDTLRSIVSLDNAASIDEIIIVSRDIDKTGEEMMHDISPTGSQLRPPRINIIVPQPRSTIAAMRNLGAGAVQSTYIAFIDADIRLTKNWLTTMYSLASDNPDTALFSAVQTPDTENSLLHRIRSTLSQKNIGTTLKCLPGANLFLSLEIFNRSDRFDETLVSCEDTIFSTSLLEHGNLLLTDKAAFVHLGEDQNLAQLFKKESFRGESNLLTLRFDMDVVDELPSLVAPMLLMSGVLIFLFALLLKGSIITMAIALGMFITPIIVWTIRFQKNDCDVEVSIMETIIFYTVYFIGRGKGMLLGPLKRLFIS